MARVTDHTRESVWQDFTDAERYLRYYTGLADKYRTRHNLVRSMLLGAILVEAVIVIPFMSEIPSPWGIVATVIVGLAIIALTVFDATSNDAKNSAKLTVAGEDCALLHVEWRSLWSDIETDVIEEREARERQRALLDRTNTIASRVELNQDEKRNLRYAAEANEVMRGRYAETS